MCAINGFNWSEKGKLFDMNEVTAHRGPDDTSVFLGEKVSLGHNRLSIIDLSEAARQPMQSNSGRYTIVFNGEIYNYKELKEELKDSYSFHTESDTEVLLALYEKYGKDTPNKLNGIFAFAIWDREKEELFLARDHIGIKPLYYYLKGDKFIFSSEIKAILEHDVPRVLNKRAFEHYMRIQYVPEPLSIFEDINKLPPAHFAIFKNNKLRIEKYWSVSPSTNLSSKEEAKKEVKNTIQRAVKRQLISDRPVGVFLSGGIDSSVVLDSVSKVKSEIDTYSIGFDLPKNRENEKFNKDFDLAKRTSEIYRTNHHTLRLKPKDLVENIEKAAWHLDEPNASVTTLSQFMISKFAKRDVAVVLGGDGGDELFGGYERYRLAKAARLYQKYVPKLIRKILSSFGRFGKLDTSAGIDQFEMFMFQEDEILKRAVNKDYISNHTKKHFGDKYFEERNEKAEVQLMDTDRRSWLVDECLFRTDRLSMASGLEVRVPILDKEVVELAYQIPSSLKVSMKETKIILKEAFKGEIPDYLYNQPKRGWFSPAAKWLREQSVENFTRNALSENYYKETGKLFNFDEVNKVLDDHINGKEYNLTIIWTILMFQLWANQFNVKVK